MAQPHIDITPIFDQILKNLESIANQMQAFVSIADKAIASFPPSELLQLFEDHSVERLQSLVCHFEAAEYYKVCAVLRELIKEKSKQ